MPSKLKKSKRKKVPVQRFILALLQTRYLREDEISSLAEKWGTKALVLRRAVTRLLCSGKVLEDREGDCIFYKLPVDALSPAQEVSGANDTEATPEPPKGPTVADLMIVISNLNQILEMSLRGLKVSYEKAIALQNRLNSEIRQRIELQAFKDQYTEHHRLQDEVGHIEVQEEGLEKLIEWWKRQNASIGVNVRIDKM